MQNANDQQPNDGTAQAKPQIIKLGLDLHARQVTECRQLDGSTPKPAQKWEPCKLLDQIETWVKAGIQVYSWSNGRGREGSINRCGNALVRCTLIEMVWRLVRWQPDYPPLQKLRRSVSRRGKRRLAVAAARRLAIDLWRLATDRATAQDLGLQLQSPMIQKPSV